MEPLDANDPESCLTVLEKPEGNMKTNEIGPHFMACQMMRPLSQCSLTTGELKRVTLLFATPVSPFLAKLDRRVVGQERVMVYTRNGECERLALERT
jgi:hypothetical protein